MQCEKPTADVVLADPPAAGAPPEPVDDGLPPHAAASPARMAVAMTPATVRTGRRGRRMTRAMSFIVPPHGSHRDRPGSASWAARPGGPAAPAPHSRGWPMTRAEQRVLGGC